MNKAESAYLEMLKEITWKFFPKLPEERFGNDGQKCAGICGLPAIGPNVVRLIDGRMVCNVCIKIFENPSFIIQKPKEPSLKYISPPLKPRRTDFIEWNHLVSVVWFIFMPCFVFLIALTERENLLVTFILSITLGLVGGIVSYFKRWRQYITALRSFLIREPELRHQYEIEVAENEAIKTAYENSEEKRLWDTLIYIRINIYDYWPGYPPDWDYRRHQVLSRDGYKCIECGNTRRRRRNPLHVHHRIKLSCGGTNKLDNLITLCRVCHSLQPGHEHMLEEIDPEDFANK